MGNTHIQALDLSTVDDAYSQIDRSTTGVPHHTSNMLSHAYSSLVNVKQNSTNEEELPQNYSVIGFKEMNQPPVAHKPDPMVVYSTVIRQTSGEKVTVKTMHKQA